MCEFWLKLYRSNEHCALGPLYVFDLSPLLVFRLETLLLHTKGVQFAVNMRLEVLIVLNVKSLFTGDVTCLNISKIRWHHI